MDPKKNNPETPWGPSLAFVHTWGQSKTLWAWNSLAPARNLLSTPNVQASKGGLRVSLHAGCAAGSATATDAARIAEYFAAEKVATQVVAAPCTIDNDLKGPFVPVTAGFDTACRVRLRCTPWHSPCRCDCHFHSGSGDSDSGSGSSSATVTETVTGAVTVSATVTVPADTIQCLRYWIGHCMCLPRRAVGCAGAPQVYSELISNICTDALSAEKVLAASCGGGENPEP